MEMDKLIEELPEKELAEELEDFKTYRAQIEAEHKAAEREYVMALGAPTTQEYRQGLQQESQRLEEKLMKIDAAIKKVEKRLGCNTSVAQESKNKGKKTAIDKNTGDAEQLEVETDTGRKILEEVKMNVQVIPSKICVEPNDVFTKEFFTFSQYSYRKALNGKKYSTRERKAYGTKKGKKKDAIYSRFGVQNVAGYDNESPFDEFDRAVMGVLTSEYLAGNRYTTVGIVYRALIGKVGDQKKKSFGEKLKNHIVESVEKLMGTVVDFSGVSKSLEEMKYTDEEGNTIKIRQAPLASIIIADVTLNGQEPINGVIYFNGNSPLFEIAEAKKQVIRRIIALKKYVMRRICEIKLHKQLTPTITFEDVFKRCRIKHTSRVQEHNDRDAIIKLFEHLKEQKFIKEYEVKKHGNAIHGVTFSF